MSRVLGARGLTDAGAAEAFLEPSLSSLHDPSTLPDLDRAAERILRAARGGEKVVIYGDYDVDGISATAILYHTLRAIAPACRVESYVPHRVDEGYGINAEAIRALAGDGARVIVSVDCGITAAIPARVAREAGVDLIITDHHTPPEREEDLPEAYACVHPTRPGSAYPFGSLSGSAVAFKLAWRLATMGEGTERVSPALREVLLDGLALASLGVIADVVPLVGENRVIARHGLSRLRRVPIEGLAALIEASGLSGQKIREEDVGFRLAPRLNACGRMGHAREAVELLTTAGGERARAIAEELTRQNDRRRALERAIFDQACERAEASGQCGDDHRCIVLADPGWHQGVVGIVCSRLIERYHRPTLLFQDHGEECHGSGRSIDGFSLIGALRECEPLLAGFGGHEMAAGVRVASGKLDDFRERFREVCNARIEPQGLVPYIDYDTHASIEELTIDGVSRLERLAPFGRGNPAVCLRLGGVRVAGRATTFGSTNHHLSVTVAADGGPMLRLIAWGQAAWAERLGHGAEIEALIVPGISTWGGRARVECVIKDWREA